MKFFTLDSGGNKFCGPAIVSILTGIKTDDSALLIRHYRQLRKTDLNPNRVEATYLKELFYALSLAGFYYEPLFENYESTIPYGEWLDNTEETRGNKTFLLMVDHHWVLVRGGWHACGATASEKGFVKTDSVDIIHFRFDAVQLILRLYKHPGVGLRDIHETVALQRKLQRVRRKYKTLKSQTK
jgi:hypothetical protein